MKTYSTSSTLCWTQPHAGTICTPDSQAASGRQAFERCLRMMPEASLKASAFNRKRDLAQLTSVKLEQAMPIPATPPKASARVATSGN